MGKAIQEIKVWWGKRFWYWITRSNKRFDERGDIRVKVQQAVDAARENYRTVGTLAGNIVGNENVAKTKLDRAVAKLAEVEDEAKAAIVEVQKAQRAGDPDQIAEMESAARSIATDVVNQRAIVEGLKQELAIAHDRSEEARRNFADAEATYQDKMNQAQSILSTAERAEMREASNRLSTEIGQLMDRTTPAMDDLQARVDKQLGAADGIASIDRGGSTAARAKIRHAQRNEAAQSVLNELAKDAGLAPIKVVNEAQVIPDTEALPAPSAVDDSIIATAEPVETPASS